MTLKKKIIATDCYGSSRAVLGNSGTILKTKNPKLFAKGISEVYKSKMKMRNNKEVDLIKNHIKRLMELF